ncbi:hypothetical protein SPRG_21284 [Saprolegnia parasitica CBS 223.65]|uniref:Uncharacterized protein n=1 Tax=Saprolegnia parasitica (strain CBS 223.65) TaxID=695850 RepID=A0A067C1J9_SAPPC|nr:hypothetical protein SPRG_21284 [Saprolegnia parasitica CBS 223.65]KDO20662.1 hypothetical protein SPRG_21284 [Saprolegnia parasitica CBS 223.65]|eukprot:XP_012208651.1 hypothetical protein SPRG_21284 [Saprolegnia parasitica CBS 223.65]
MHPPIPLMSLFLEPGACACDRRLSYTAGLACLHAARGPRRQSPASSSHAPPVTTNHGVPRRRLPRDESFASLSNSGNHQPRLARAVTLQPPCPANDELASSTSMNLTQ